LWRNCFETVPPARMPLKHIPPRDPPEMGALNLRDIPKEQLYKLKMAAAAEHRTVKGFILNLIEIRIEELEKKGLLPKGKG
jgi:hypothetical protein